MEKKVVVITHEILKISLATLKWQEFRFKLAISTGFYCELDEFFNKKNEYVNFSNVILHKKKFKYKLKQ